MYSRPSVPSFGFVIAVSQVVMEVVFLLLAPSSGGAPESGLSPLGVVDNGLIEVACLLFRVTTSAMIMCRLPSRARCFGRLNHKEHRLASSLGRRIKERK